MENTNTKKLICRKCGGEHLTVKCGKEATNNTGSKSEVTSVTQSSSPVTLKKEYVKTEFKESEKPRRINKVNDTNEEDSDSEKKPRWRKDGGPRESGQNDNRRSGDNNFRERRPLHKVKMSNLPQDMTEEELLELLYDWGNVIRMRVLNYNQNSTAYIEFKNQDEADYLVKALDKTPFEHIMISVERLYD
jgi:RNA recognition motif-containing protein